MSSSNSIQVVPSVLYAASDLNRINKIEKQLRPYKFWQRYSSIHAGKLNGKVNYRPRSYKSYKTPRKVKLKLKKILEKKKDKKILINTNIINLYKDNWSKLCRKHRKKLQKQNFYQIFYKKLNKNNKENENNNENLINKKRKYLLTHNWHAKRMIYNKLNNIKQPLKNCAYGYKSLDRIYTSSNLSILSLPSRSLIYDNSLNTPIEIKGNRLIIKKILSKIIDPSHPLLDLLYDQRKINSREYTVLLYELNGFPLLPLGPIDIIINCIRINNNSPKKSFEREINIDNNEEIEREEIEDLDQVGSYDLFQLIFFPHPLLFDTLYNILQGIHSDLSSHPTLSFLPSVFSIKVRHDLARFRFYGKASQDFLLQYFKKFSSENSENFQILQDFLSEGSQLGRVWKNGYIMSTSIKDPRYFEAEKVFPPVLDKKEKKKNHFQWKPSFSSQSKLWKEQSLAAPLPSNAVYSRVSNNKKLLWSKLVDQYKKSSDFTMQPIVSNDLNSLNLASFHSGSISSLEIPLLLIHHEKIKQNHITSRSLYGFSLLLPSPFASLLWNSLINFKTSDGFKPVALGEEEVHHLQKTEGILSFPYDYFDSSLAKEALIVEKKQRDEENQKKPKGKRAYNGFYEDIDKIFYRKIDADEEEKKEKEASIVRVHTYLTDFQPPETIVKDSWFVKTKELLSVLSSTNTTSDSPNNKRMKLTLEDRESFPLPTLPTLPSRLHIHIVLTPLSRGGLQRGAVLFCPSEEDLIEYIRYSSLNKASIKEEEEEKKEDEEEIVEDKKEKRHKKLLPRWKGFFDSLSQSKSLSDNSLRQPIGYVTSGHKPHTFITSHAVTPYLYHLGKSNISGGEDEEDIEEKLLYNCHNPKVKVHAIGFLSIQDYYEKHLDKSYGKLNHPLAHRLVLFRNPGSSYFRPAIFSIL